MIVTNTKHLPRYLGTSPTLDTALRYLMDADLSRLVPGRNEVSGDDVYINRFAYDTVDEKNAFWEGHVAYGDIHVILEGSEKIGINAPENLTETARKEDEDFLGFTGPVKTWVNLTKGDILIVYPEDVHLTKVTDGAPSHVEKAVVKFRI